MENILEAERLQCPPVSEFENICRICFGNSELCSIFKLSNETSRDISAKIRYYCKTEIQHGDGLPDKICQKCIETLEMTDSFIVLSQHSDKKLRNALQLAEEQNDEDNNAYKYLQSEVEVYFGDDLMAIKNENVEMNTSSLKNLGIKMEEVDIEDDYKTDPLENDEFDHFSSTKTDVPIEIMSTSLEEINSSDCKEDNILKIDKSLNNKYSSNYEFKPSPCGHATDRFQCTQLKASDIKIFHDAFYENTTKLKQDAFITKYCTSTKAKNQIQKFKKSRKKNITIKYFMWEAKKKKKIPVCQKLFMRTLNLKSSRIQGVIKRFTESKGKPPKETRGGDTKGKQFNFQREEMSTFINSLKGSESHNCVSEMTTTYLSKELNIKKLWDIYNKGAQISVKEDFFREYYQKKFNFSFGSPSTDNCFTCKDYQRKVKIEKDCVEKNNLMTRLNVHRLKSEAFSLLMKEEQPDLITMSFSCQKNLPLPKIPDEAAIFSRQFNFYHFCVVTGSFDSLLTHENVHSYIWDETQLLKSSNEIASALFHRLCITDYSNIKIVRLIANGCSAQNKNSVLISMIAKWLLSHAPDNIISVEVIFPIVGHFFLPPDYAFEKIEKNVKSKVVLNPNDYAQVIKEFSTVFALGTDVPVFDWCSEVTKYIKPSENWHFNLGFMKRLYFFKTKNNVKIQGELDYNSMSGNAQYITKGKCFVFLINPEKKLINKKPLNRNKVNDVKNLLTKYFGENWRQLDSLKFYKNAEILASDSEDDSQEPLCQYFGDD